MGIFKEHQETLVTCVSSGGTVSSGACSIANGAANLTNGTGTPVRSYTARLSTNSSQTAPGASNTYFVSLYLAPITDGTNTDTVDTSDATPSPAIFAGNFYWQGGSSGSGTEYMSIDLIQVNAVDYVPYIVNNLGVTLHSGWTLQFAPTDDQY